MSKDFWSKATVAVIGGGSWGSVLAQLAAANCREVRVWVRSADHAAQLNSTKSNPRYVPELEFSKNVVAHQEVNRIFEGGVQAVIWALPSKACRERAQEMASLFSGEEVLLHAVKGIEQSSFKTMSQVLGEELPLRRLGVISGPNLAREIARGEPAGTVVASNFDEVVQAGHDILSCNKFRVYGANDVVGVEWAGTLKNVLALASGCLNGMSMGWNLRSMLISRGLAEMVRLGSAMGAEPATFLGLAGVGDLMATCGSPLSRNYQMGYRIAKGESVAEVLSTLGSTVEGVQTAQTVWEYAKERKILMPITEIVCRVVREEVSPQDGLQTLFERRSVVAER